MAESDRMYRTKEAIRQALMQLIETERRDVARIKVTEIIAAARVSKATFYRYYRDVYDLLNDCFATYLDIQDVTHAAADERTLAEHSRELILTGTRKIRAHPTLYLTCIQCSYAPFVNDFSVTSTNRSAEVQRMFNAELGTTDENCLIPAEQLATICRNLATSINVDWVQRGCIETPEQVADLINTCVRNFARSMRRADQ